MKYEVRRTEDEGDAMDAKDEARRTEDVGDAMDAKDEARRTEDGGAGAALVVGGEAFRDDRELLAFAPARICELDARARHAAKETVACALAAGALLLAVRERLPHGAFLAWVATSCPSVSHRTATKYMALSEAVRAEALPAPEVDERSLTQLYRDYGIVRRPGGWGGAREGAGRPARDPSAEAAAAAADPDLGWAEAGGFLKGLYDFGMERDGFGTLADDDLESLVAMLASLERRAAELLAARRRGPCGAEPVDVFEAARIVERGL